MQSLPWSAGLLIWTALAAAQTAPPVAPPVVSSTHPRLVFRPAQDRGLGRTFEDVRALYRTDPFFRATFDQALKSCESATNPAMTAACWIVSGDERFAQASARILAEQTITQSGSGAYSDVWAFALAWDWLYHHPALAGGLRERVAARIAERLATELAQLDDTGMAMWHGRNQATNGAIIAALALAGLPGQDVQLGRAAGHYAEALRALDFSEGWPEGPSYWIYNRALPFGVAADCYMTATGSETAGGVSIRNAMRKIGLWTLYQYGPNGVFEPYGDSVGSLRLGETGMWEASIDYFAKLSHDPGVVAGSDYFRQRSPAPYGKRPIHWYVALAYDPAARPAAGYDPAKPELWLRANMPQSMLFGRNTLGVAFLRGAWGDPNELFASFKAGDMLAHHDHYNAGTFSIQLAGLLAPLTGVYGASDYGGPYRLGYAIQTVASNSLLILAPGEKFAKGTPLSGGQRIVNPTGFDCVSLDHFRQQLKSGRLERGGITAFQSVAGRGDYLAADITPAYNSTRYADPGSEAKVSLVTRQFLYVRSERAYVIFDRVETTNAGYTPKFLLHSLAKPRTANERLLAGTDASDGILESRDRAVTLDGDHATLTQRILLPLQARTLKIGGPHFASFVQTGADLQGTNLEPDPGKGGASPKPKGLWRVEVEPATAGQSHRFLNVLLPKLKEDQRSAPQVELLKTNPGAVAVRVGASVAVMAQDAAPLERVELNTPVDAECWILNARPGADYSMNGKKWTASAEGVLVLPWPRGKRTLTLLVRR
ncbi:MAG: hypothetical protein IPP47_28945 [Bryobacterales bacterium]|nr:hypothetical protein [Bryobacterales bacterium]